MWQRQQAARKLSQECKVAATGQSDEDMLATLTHAKPDDSTATVAALQHKLRLEHQMRLQLCASFREQHVRLLDECGLIGDHHETIEVDSCSTNHHQLSWGMIVACADASCAPLQAEHQTYSWATCTCLRKGLPQSGVQHWLVNVMPYDLNLRADLMLQTGLVAWAGHIDQTGVEDGRVRVLLDDFVREHAQPMVVNVLERAKAEAVHQGHVALKVRFPSGRTSHVVAWSVQSNNKGKTKSFTRGPALGWLPCANLVMAGEPSTEQLCRVTCIGPMVEIVTSFEDWCVCVCFSPKHQAHGNALCGLHDKFACTTVRLVPFVGIRDASTIRKEEAMLCSEWSQLKDNQSADAAAAAQHVESTSTGACVLLDLHMNKVRGAFVDGAVSGGTVRDDDSLLACDTYAGGDVLALGYRGRTQRGDVPIVSDTSQSPVWPLQLRSIHHRHGDVVQGIVMQVAPLLGMAANALHATACIISLRVETNGGASYDSRSAKTFPCT